MTWLTTSAAVLITGAVGGIGRAVAQAVHAAGSNVALLDLDEAKVRDLAAELDAERPGSASASSGSAAREADVSAWVDKAVAEYGGLAGLVNVAGMWRSQAFTELTMAEVDEIIEANLRTAIVCCRAVCQPMLDRGAGSIVNFASTAGEYGSISPAAHYAASKGGIIALTKSLARELSPRGVRVNAISPGPIDTLGLSQGTSASCDEVAARTLLGRLGTPREIADCVEFLLSDKASFITGHVLRANGGSLL